ncbi:hypothetical protein V6Z11_D10G116600 [Gossypium hirsutum]
MRVFDWYRYYEQRRPYINRFWERVCKNETSTYPIPLASYSWLSTGFEDRSSNRFEIPTNFILKFKFEHEEFPLLTAKFGSNSQTVQESSYERALLMTKVYDVVQMFHTIRARWSIAFHTFVTAWREFTFTLEDVRVLLEISCFGKYNIFSIELLEEEKQIQDFFDLFKSEREI